MRTDFDIIVIGGGIVGACTAALAAAQPQLRGLRIALIDAQVPAMPPPDGDVDLRVSAFSRASERILTSIGAWRNIAPKHLSAYHEMVVWDAAGKAMGPASIHFSASASSEPNLGHIVENRRVLWAIFASPAFRERVTVLQGTLAALSLETDCVAVTLDDGRRYTSQLVVGSDGSDSMSRKLAGIETDGRAYRQSAFVTHVRTEHPHRATAWQRFQSVGALAFLPLADGRSSIVWSTTPEHAATLVEAAPDAVEQELADALDQTLGKVTLSGPRGAFPLRIMHAQSYCSERFVLVGDAAHTVHPLAGQGVNLGLLDAAALIETLAEAVAAGASNETFGEQRVLRRYERWRKSENTLALGLIDGLNTLFGSSRGVTAQARQWGLSIVNRSTPLKRALMSRAMGITGELPRAARATKYNG
jgi:2-octaprenylphenol hydroxylase